jgi:hypothetical protein
MGWNREKKGQEKIKARTKQTEDGMRQGICRRTY